MIAVGVNHKIVLDGIDEAASCKKRDISGLFSGTSPALTLDYYRDLPCSCAISSIHPEFLEVCLIRSTGRKKYEP